MIYESKRKLVDIIWVSSGRYSRDDIGQVVDDLIETILNEAVERVMDKLPKVMNIPMRDITEIGGMNCLITSKRVLRPDDNEQ